MRKPKIIVFDIETTPIVAYTWDLYPSALSHDNIISDWSIICAAWKEVGKSKVDAVAISKVGDDKAVVLALRNALAEADIIVGHYIDKFDIRKLNARLIYHNLPPLPRIPTIDTKKEAKKIGAFTSNRLDYLSKHLHNKGKMHVDYQLWLDVMKGSSKAVDKMVKYNKVDVIRNEEVYLSLRPFMKSHPHMGVLSDKTKQNCTKCGGNSVKRGVRISAAGVKRQEYQCTKCGSYHSVPYK